MKMTELLTSKTLVLLWMLCGGFITAAQEDVPCPKGGQIHLSRLRCYWLSEMTLSWSEAQDSCRKIPGGDLADVQTLELQTFIQRSFLVLTDSWTIFTDSIHSRSSVWTWMKASEDHQNDGIAPARGSGGPPLCPQMVLGTQGQVRTSTCSGSFHFLCEKQVTESIPSTHTYLSGLVHMTGVYSQVQMWTLQHPDVGQCTVEMQLFPGVWFSHAGHLVSVELVVQPSPQSSLARIQILRPYCSPTYHLVPPGCGALLNPFSCCSAIPLCNATGGCGAGQYWCHLLEACVSVTRPCSPYDSDVQSRGFPLPPRYTAVPPFYHPVADLPLRVEPTSTRQHINLVLPDIPIVVYPDDIVAIQHTRESGTFLHCRTDEASVNWCQSYLSIRGEERGGWWDGGITSPPHTGQWVDGVVCNLKILYVDTQHMDVFGSTHMDTTTASDGHTLTDGPVLQPGLSFIHPIPDENNHIHVQVNIPTLIVIRVWSGDEAWSSWSAPVLQTRVPFLPSCPEEVDQASILCTDPAWFSSVTLVLSSVGVHMLNVTVTGPLTSQSVTVLVCGYEAVTGLSVQPHGCLRMLVDKSQSFTTRVETGSSVTFTWVLDNLNTFAYEGESYSIVLRKPAEYKLRVTASNPVSSQTQVMVLRVDKMTPMTEPEVLAVKEVVAVDVAELYTVRVKVDISLPVSFRWDFGDSSSEVIHTHSAPCQTMEGLVDRTLKQVYALDSVNHTFYIPDDYILHVHVSNQYFTSDLSVKIRVRPQLHRLLLSSSALVSRVHHRLLLEASTEPSTDTVVYTWNFGDGSNTVQDVQPKVSHVFGSTGLYNITACANNSLSAVTTWIMVEIMEEVCGLMVSYSGPREVNSVIDFRAHVSSGTSLFWSFNFGDGSQQGNLTGGSISHIYKSPGNYTVGVTVSNSVSQVYQSITVEVYRLEINGILPIECVIRGKNIQFTALVNGNVSMLTFHWLFGDGSLSAVVTGQSTTSHTFRIQRVFPVHLTVFGPVSHVSFNGSICVESLITSVTMKPSQSVVSIGEEVCFLVLVSPELITGSQFKWFSSSSSLSAVTQTNQKCFVFHEEGMKEVSVTASNNVSNKTAQVSVIVQKPVGMLSMAHNSQSDTLMVNSSTTFWVTSCSGSNVTVLWDFGDGSPIEEKQNASHVFTSTGQFLITATVFNSVSQESATLQVKVLLPVQDLSLHTKQLSVAVGEDTLFTAVSSNTNSTKYCWIVDNVIKQGTHRFRFAFPKPGVYRVTVIAENLVSKEEATVLVEVFERIVGLQIECQNLRDMKYVPAQEETQFTASVIKGSNVSYQWRVTQNALNQQIQGAGEVFRLMVENPGLIFIQLRAANKLGEVTSNVSVMAVERVSGANMAVQSGVVPLGEPVNMTVSVAAGSDLRYLWYFNSDPSPIHSHVPFLYHTFTQLGHYYVSVSIQNILSQSNVSVLFVVQEEVHQVDFEIEGKKQPFYICTNDSVSLSGHINKGSDLYWDWKVRGAKDTLIDATNQTFTCRFLHAGIYQVYLNVSNEINWQMVSHRMTVQDAIEGLELKLSRSSLCTEEEVAFVPTVSKGSNVSFILMFRDKDLSYSYEFVEEQFTTSRLPAGNHRVTVKARNQVSSAQVSSSVLITERIQGLQLKCCSAVLEALKGLSFKADVENGFPVNYTWIFDMEGYRSTWLTGQEVVFTAPDSGLLFVSVVASNGVCSEKLKQTIPVELPVREVALACHSERIFPKYSVTFSAKVDEGSMLRYVWDFGDSTKLLMDLHTVNHTYDTAGKYSIMVKVFNNVSHVSSRLQVNVQELQCSNPQVSLVHGQSTIFRSRPSFFEAAVDMSCSAYKTRYLWEIFRAFDCTNLHFTGNRTDFSSPVDVTSPFLQIPKHALEVGQYCLVFTVLLKGTPLLAQQKTSITVVHSPLVAVIKGGSYRWWPSHIDLVLDGCESGDPDVKPRLENELLYNWTVMTVAQNSTESPFVKQPFGSNSSKMTVSNTQLNPRTVYVFTLTVHKSGRRPVSVNQTVMVCDASLLPVTVECTSCSILSSPHHITESPPINLSGQCLACDDQAQYQWTVVNQSGQTLNLDEITPLRGSPSLVLMMRSGVFQPDQSYTFSLNVSDPVSGRWGSASLTVRPNWPPHGGVCSVSPESDIHVLETVVTYSCSGWEDDEGEASQLIYWFQVVPCQPSTALCPVLTLYRGTRSTFGSVVPVGSPDQTRGMSVITVLLLIEDHLGAKAVALNRTLMVENPTHDEDVSQWLRNKSQTQLWTVVQHGNPQEIIPYSIALTSYLNQMESGRNIQELQDRMEVRGNVTHALASLSVSSLKDVDQIGSALVQSTAVPSELVCKDCQKKVLEAVGKMIQVIQQYSSTGVVSVVDTGRILLNVIGNTLASVSVSVSTSYPDLSASAMSLSVLGQTSALMRSLMPSHVPDRPLSICSPYISTVGFHGRPSDLLCTHRSNQSNQPTSSPSALSFTDRFENSDHCPILIPVSFTDHLKTHSSEVVQVVYTVNDVLGSNPLLTAADPPISTTLVAMELTTPQGRPILIQDLNPEETIRVTLPNKYHVEQSGGQRSGGERNRTCLTVTLPNKGRLNFTVKDVDGLDKHAGLYISFNFSQVPGATLLSSGSVTVEVSSTWPEANASHNSLVRDWSLSLCAPDASMEKTVFLSPLLNRTDRPLSVGLTSVLGPGAPVQVSLCVFSSLCQFYNEEQRRWSSEGLRPLEGSTLHTAHCLTQHLTLFGASVFVHPGAVVLLPPPSGGPVRNMVVGVVCGVLVLIHLLVGLIAHKLDHLDGVRLSRVPLCGRAGLYTYRVLVKTGWRRGAGTTAHVGISLYGVNKSGSRHLQRDGAFQRGSLDQFHLETDHNLGEVWKIRIWHDNTGLDPSWYVKHVVVWDPQTDHMFFFLLNDWLSVENLKNGTVEKEVLASCPEELTQFGRVFMSQLMFGMVERHLWLSLWERPAHSRFTRGQRVTCSALLLHVYLALGALWYGAVSTTGTSGPVSAQMPVTMETAAVGMSVAVLVFPLQCLLCSLFRRIHSQVTVDMSLPPSPVCHSVLMDMSLVHPGLSGPSVLSLLDSSGPFGQSPSSVLESRLFDSSLLDFWAASGLVSQTRTVFPDEGLAAWPSCDSLLNLPAVPHVCQESFVVGRMRLLRRKKAMMQLGLTPPSSSNSLTYPTQILPLSNTHRPRESPLQGSPGINMNPKTYNHHLSTLLTLSDEDLLMSIEAAEEDAADAVNSNSDSGWDSPTPLSTLRSGSCDDWSEQSEVKNCPLSDGRQLYKCPSVNSVSSTFLPSPSPDSTGSSSSTRIGVVRGHPRCLLPPWALYVIYPLVVLFLGVCLSVVGLYGASFSRTVVLMWLLSALSAFLTSALLLDPLKVCFQALVYTLLWRPVDPEVDDHLSHESMVVRSSGEQGGRIRPPGGYGLLQAKEEARKVRALHSLMKNCVKQLLFLLLLLMVNYQDGPEQREGRKLQSAVRQHLHTSARGVPNLSSITDWSDAERWVIHTLVPHIHESPSLHLVGLPRLQYSCALGPVVDVIMGNHSETTTRLINDLNMGEWRKTQFRWLSVDFTHYHTHSALFVCVSVQLEMSQTHRVIPFLSIHPLLISSSSRVDLHLALAVLLLLSALLISFGEVWTMVTEHVQYLHLCSQWFHLLLASLSLATAILQLCFLSLSTSCVTEFHQHPDRYISFHCAALLAQRSSQTAAVLLTLLVLKLVGTLRFVRRWVVIGRVLHRAWRELWAVTVLLLLQILLCSHLGNALFSDWMEDFLSPRQAVVSVLSILRGRLVLQRLIRVHPSLGPFYGVLIVGGALWVLGRLCGAVLIRAYRSEQVEMYHATMEPQDYEMVEFFIKRLKLWMGLTKAKEFRHRVKFEDMDIPPSRSSQDSRLSTVSSPLPSSCSPSLSRPPSLSSALSIRSEDSSEPGFDVQPYLDRLLPCVNTLLCRFDCVNQITDDVHNLEMKLEEAQVRRRKSWIQDREKNRGRSGDSGKPKKPDREAKGTDVRHRKTGFLYPTPRLSLPSSLFFTPFTLHSCATVGISPRIRSSHSESESLPLHIQASPSAKLDGLSPSPAASPGLEHFPRRRAWHSGSSHSADTAQRIFQSQDPCGNRIENLALINSRPRSQDGLRWRISEGVPVKRKAWTCEGEGLDL